MYKREELCSELEGVTFDVDRMVAQLEEMKKNESHGSFRTFQGFGMLTRTGESNDGFNWKIDSQHPPIEEQDLDQLYPQISFNLDVCRRDGLYHPLDYKTPTKYCTGYLKQVIDELEAMGIYIRRARIAKLSPESKIFRHSDCGIMRLHVPIITSDKIKFTIIDEDFWLEAGKCYLVRTTEYHHVVNESPDERWHLVADCYNTSDRFPFGKLDSLDEELENARVWRNYVDKVSDEPHILQIGREY